MTNSDDQKTYPNYHIPEHPTDGFFETTVVKHEFEDGKGFVYTHLDYERQRKTVFGDIGELRDRAYETMLDDGWTPTSLPLYADGTGGPSLVLVPPSIEVQREMRRLEKANDRAEATGQDRPHQSPGREAIQKVAKASKTPKKKSGSSGLRQVGSEGGCYS